MHNESISSGPQNIALGPCSDCERYFCHVIMTQLLQNNVPDVVIDILRFSNWNIAPSSFSGLMKNRNY